MADRDFSDSYQIIDRESGILPNEKEDERSSLLTKVKEKYGWLLDNLVTEKRSRNYSLRTEKTYLGWACRITLGGRDIRESGESEVADFLSRLTGVFHLMAAPLYGTGIRLMECVRQTSSGTIVREPERCIPQI